MSSQLVSALVGPSVSPRPEVVEEPQLFDEVPHIPYLPNHYDDLDSWNPATDVVEYVGDIMAYCRQRQTQFKIGQYMNRQKFVDPKMRAELVNWMFKVTMDFDLFSEIYYLAVKLLDVFMDRFGGKVIEKDLKLIGGTAIYTATKYECRYDPSIDDFVTVCDNAYTAKEFKRMELMILKAIDCELGIPTSLFFLGRFVEKVQASKRTEALARYILDTALMFHEFIEVKDDILAAGAILLALRMRGHDWQQSDIKWYTTYTYFQVEAVMHALNHMLYRWNSYYSEYNYTYIWYADNINFHAAMFPGLVAIAPPHIDIAIPEHAVNK